MFYMFGRFGFAGALLPWNPSPEEGKRLTRPILGGRDVQPGDFPEEGARDGNGDGGIHQPLQHQGRAAWSGKAGSAVRECAPQLRQGLEDGPGQGPVYLGRERSSAGRRRLALPPRSFQTRPPCSFSEFLSLLLGGRVCTPHSKIKK